MLIKIPFAIAKGAFLLLLHANRNTIEVKVGEDIYKLRMSIPSGSYEVKLDTCKNDDWIGSFKLDLQATGGFIDICAHALIYNPEEASEKWCLEVRKLASTEMDYRIWIIRNGEAVTLSIESDKVDNVCFPLYTNF